MRVAREATLSRYDASPSFAWFSHFDALPAKSAVVGLTRFAKWSNTEPSQSLLANAFSVRLMRGAFGFQSVLQCLNAVSYPAHLLLATVIVECKDHSANFIGSRTSRWCVTRWLAFSLRLVRVHLLGVLGSVLVGEQHISSFRQGVVITAWPLSKPCPRSP
jgi:hypothetical protein